MVLRSENLPSPALRPIFMVDDDADDRLLFYRLVRGSGTDRPLQTFARGEDLIDALIAVLRGAPPPLACFLDVKMPGMTGFDVLRWIRCQHALDGLPVIMLSTSEESRDLGEAGHFGAQCYVAKFPSQEAFNALLAEAAQAADRSGLPRFNLPVNLLLDSPALAGGPSAVLP